MVFHKYLATFDRSVLTYEYYLSMTSFVSLSTYNDNHNVENSISFLFFKHYVVRFTIPVLYACNLKRKYNAITTVILFDNT